MSVTKNYVLISIEFSTCQLCQIRLENVIAGVIKLIPGGTRVHIEGGTIEICIEDFSYGGGLQFGIVGSILYSLICLLQIGNKIIYLTFASIPMIEVNYLINSESFGHLVYVISEMSPMLNFRREEGFLLFFWYLY